jgi:hypothetical protein
MSHVRLNSRRNPSGSGCLTESASYLRPVEPVMRRMYETTSTRIRRRTRMEKFLL